MKSGEALGELPRVADDLNLSDQVRLNPDRISCRISDDPSLLIDMDTPEDYHRICGMFESV